MTKRLIYESAAGPLWLDYRKIAFLPRSKTLLVADLHFEKGSYLQAAGNSVLPAYDTRDSLQRLGALIADYAPLHVVALGDSFHDLKAEERLRPSDSEALNTLIGRTARFTWIVGNHDPEIPSQIEGEREDHLEIDGFLLTHMPIMPDAGVTNICGHLHPKAQISIRRRRMSYPCFACSDMRVILPSFGAYTGGLFVNHPAIESVMGDRRMLALTSKTAIFPI